MMVESGRVWRRGAPVRVWPAPENRVFPILYLNETYNNIKHTNFSCWCMSSCVSDVKYYYSSLKLSIQNLNYLSYQTSYKIGTKIILCIYNAVFEIRISFAKNARDRCLDE